MQKFKFSVKNQILKILLIFKITGLIAIGAYLSGCESEQGRGNLLLNFSYGNGDTLQTKVYISIKDDAMQGQGIQGKTDANGNFYISGLLASEYNLFIENYGRILHYNQDSFMRANKKDFLKIEKNTTKKLNLKVAAGKNISGDIQTFDKKTPNAGMNYLVNLFRDGEENPVASTTSKNGKFEFKNAPAGKYNLATYHYNKKINYVNNEKSSLNKADKQPINLTTADIKDLKLYLLEGKTLNFSIKDFKNNSINEDERVYLFTNNSIENKPEKFYVVETFNFEREFDNFFIAKKGELSFKNIPDGKYKICAAKYNLGAYCYTKTSTTSMFKDADTIEIKGADQNLTLKLPEGKNLSGTLTYQDGTPVKNSLHSVILYDAKTNKPLKAMQDNKNIFSYVDDKGHFRFINLPDGEYKLSVRDYLTEVFYKNDTSAIQVLEEATSIKVDSKDTQNIDKKFVITKGQKVSGKFYLNGKPLASKNLFIGQIGADAKISALANKSKADGEFEFNDIPKGEHYLFIMQAGNKPYYYKENSNAVTDAKQATKIKINSTDIENLEFKFSY